MELAEFAAEFDIIYENINKGGAPGLIHYEKSVILTQAAEDLARQLVNIDLSLIAELITVDTPVIDATPVDRLDDRSVVFEMSQGFIRIINETVKDSGDVEYVVTPISAVEYSLIMSKPYKYPRRRTAWRLENSDTVDGYVELIGRPGVTLTEYKARIVSLPNPIVLETLTGGLSIRGITAASNTNLNPSLHPEILKLATGLAEKYYYDKYGNDESGNN